MNLKQCAVALLLWLLAGGALAQPVVLQLQTPVAVDSPEFAATINPWIQRVEEDSRGRVRIEARGSESPDTVAPAALYEALSEGRIDLAWTMPSLSPSRFPRVEVFELPFLMTEAEPVSRALWEYVSIYAVDEFKEVKVLGLHVRDAALIHARASPVEGLASLQGMRLHAGGRQLTRLLTALGVKPQARATNDIAEAIRSDALDGAALAWTQLADLGLASVTRFHTGFEGRSGSLTTATYLLAMNRQRYESLPADLKAVIDRNTGLELSGQLGQAFQVLSQRSRQLPGTENTIITLSSADAEAFRKAATSVDQLWVKEVTDKGFDGQKLLDGARTLVKKYTK